MPSPFPCSPVIPECSSNKTKIEKKIQESYNVKYFKEIKLLKSLQKAEAYLEPKQASMMELFVNILNGRLFLQ